MCVSIWDMYARISFAHGCVCLCVSYVCVGSIIISMDTMIIDKFYFSRLTDSLIMKLVRKSLNTVELERFSVIDTVRVGVDQCHRCI